MRRETWSRKRGKNEGQHHDHHPKPGRYQMEVLQLYRRLQNSGNQRNRSRRMTALSVTLRRPHGGLPSHCAVFLCRCHHASLCRPAHPHISIVYPSHRSWITHKHMVLLPASSQGDLAASIFREPLRTFIIRRSQNSHRQIHPQPSEEGR